MMHYERLPVSSYYVIAEFASLQIIFGATVITTTTQRTVSEDTKKVHGQFAWRILVGT